VESSQNSHRLLRLFREQLLFWESLVGESVRCGGRESDIIQRCVEQLIKADPGLAAFDHMDEDTRKRERIFMANSVKGFVGFLKEKLKGDN